MCYFHEVMNMILFSCQFYYRETIKSILYRSYYIKKAPTLLRIETYGIGGGLYISGYGAGFGSVEVWQYNYEIH